MVQTGERKGEKTALSGDQKGVYGQAAWIVAVRLCVIEDSKDGSEKD